MERSRLGTVQHQLKTQAALRKIHTERVSEPVVMLWRRENSPALAWNLRFLFLFRPPKIFNVLDIKLSLCPECCMLSLGDSPASEFYMLTFRNTVFHLHRHAPTCLWRWNRQSVPKRRHIKFRRRGITQKKAYIFNIFNSTVFTSTLKKISNELCTSSSWVVVNCIL